MCLSLLKKTAFQLLEIRRMYRPLREQARSHMVFYFLGNRRELRDREVPALIQATAMSDGKNWPCGSELAHEDGGLAAVDSLPRPVFSNRCRIDFANCVAP